MLEHGAYTLLMDRYYSTEAGIPDEEKYRVVRAISKPERAAVDAVLKEFFSLVDGVWMKNRIEEEIQKYLDTIPEAEQRKENDKQRQRRARQRRSELFAELQSRGVTMPWNAKMSELHEELSRIKAVSSPQRHGPVTCDNTATQSPVPRHQSPEEEPSARSLGGEDARAQGDEREATAAGQACMAMREAGLMLTNPSHPHLLAALEEGVTPAGLADVVRECPGKPMAYVVNTARGRKRDQGLPRVARIAAIPSIGRVPLKTSAEIELEEREREAHGTH